MFGFETTSSTLASTLAGLANHEEVQEDVRREVLRACPLGKEVTEEAIDSVTLLRNCISGSCRTLWWNSLFKIAVSNQNVLLVFIIFTLKQRW